MIRTAPELFAAAHGVACSGPHRCYYCGAPAGEANPASDHVKPSFTAIAGVASPGSEWVCDGCVLCFNDTGDVRFVDGETRFAARCAVRAWSWVVTPRSALAASKAHMARLREACLSGPGDSPWCVVLSDSGQKQLLYRGVVNHGPPPWRVSLEGEVIAYEPDALAGRLALCGRIAAASGKPALAAPVDFRLAAAVIARYRRGDELIREWSCVLSQPLSRLAAWLAPNKEECQVDYPADPPEADPEPGPAAAAGPRRRSVPPRSRGAGVADAPTERARVARREGHAQPLLFDPG